MIKRKRRKGITLPSKRERSNIGSVILFSYYNRLFKRKLLEKLRESF